MGHPQPLFQYYRLFINHIVYNSKILFKYNSIALGFELLTSCLGSDHSNQLNSIQKRFVVDTICLYSVTYTYIVLELLYLYEPYE